MNVVLSDEAKKFLKKVPKKDTSVILKKLHSIRNDPFPHLKKLSGSKLWRLRVLKYRAIVDVVIKADTLYVVRVGYRKNVYDD